MRCNASSFSIAACFAALTVTLGVAAAAPNEGPLFGFNAANSNTQRDLEKKFDSQLNAADLRAWLKQLSSAANHVGAPHNKENAEFMQRQFAAWGWDAQIETFEVLYP